MTKKMLKELIRALYSIRDAISGESKNTKKDNGLFGADAIIYPVQIETESEQETEVPIYDYKIFYSFDEFFDYFKTQAPYDNIKQIIFGYKSDNIDIVGKPYRGELEDNALSTLFVLEDSSSHFYMANLGEQEDKLNGLYAIMPMGA